MEQKRMRVHPRHWSLLVDFMEGNKELVTGKYSGTNGRQKYNSLWNEITEKLDSIGLGEKTVEKWKIAFQDWKCKVKSKARAMKSHSQATGGGPQIDAKLNENEQRLLGLLGHSTIHGIDEVDECGIEKFIENSTSEEVHVTIERDQEILDVEDGIVANRNNIEVKLSSITSDEKSHPKKRKKNDHHEANDEQLDKYQKETMEILNKININVERLADSSSEAATALHKIACSLELLTSQSIVYSYNSI